MKGLASETLKKSTEMFKETLHPLSLSQKGLSATEGTMGYSNKNTIFEVHLNLWVLSVR